MKAQKTNERGTKRQDSVRDCIALPWFLERR